MTRRTFVRTLVCGAAMVALTTACTPQEMRDTASDVNAAGNNYTGNDAHDIGANGEAFTPNKEDALDQEDPPKYNCLTQGDGVCGYRYHSLPNNIHLQLMQDKMIDATTACKIKWGNTSKIVCDNGLVTTS